MEGLSIGYVHSVLQGHTGDVNSTSWSPVSRDILCSCGGDKTIRVWRINVDKPVEKNKENILDPIETVAAHKLYVTACAYNPSGDLLATTSSDDTVKLWSTASWTCTGELSLHKEGVRSCCFSPDGNLIASSSDDNTVRVWEVGALKCISTITNITKNEEGRVTCCLFFPNGWLLATGALDGKFFLFDAFSGKCVSKKRTSIHDGGINTIALQPFELGDTSSVNQSLPKPDQFSTGGQNYHCATAGNDYTTKIWKIRESPIDGNRSVTITMLAELRGHSAPVYTCDYHPSRPFLATGSADKTVIIWSVISFNQVQQIQAHLRYVTHIKFSPSGLFLATGSNDRTIKVWSLGSSTNHTDTEDASASPPAYTEEAVKKPSIISTATWSVENVCQWAESVTKQQNSPGGSVHPDDLRAAERLIGALEQLSLGPEDKGGDDFKCPITCEVMRDPVVASDGYSYERSAITGWFSKGRRTSPVTNLPLTSTLLLPNRVLKLAIDREK